MIMLMTWLTIRMYIYRQNQVKLSLVFRDNLSTLDVLFTMSDY